jgi:hypothetical protein
MTYIHPLETIIQTKQYYTSKYFTQRTDNTMAKRKRTKDKKGLKIPKG